jgi:uncharacterized protein
MKHAHHTDIAVRLRRAEGHLRSVIVMLQDGRGCVEIAQQLHAVEAAIANAKRELIHDHISHCLEEGLANGAMSAGDVIDEVKTLTKYL